MWRRRIESIESRDIRVLRIDDDLALHLAVVEAAELAALKLVSARGPRGENNRTGFVLLEFDAIRSGGDFNPRFAALRQALRDRLDADVVLLVVRGHLYFYRLAHLHMHRRRSELVI